MKNAIPPNPSANPYAETLGSYTTYMVAVCNGLAMGLCQKGWRSLVIVRARLSAKEPK